jgi:hypothetical protein
VGTQVARELTLQGVLQSKPQLTRSVQRLTVRGIGGVQM